jgi:hypothetical protein
MRWGAATVIQVGSIEAFNPFHFFEGAYRKSWFQNISLHRSLLNNQQ